METAWDYTCLTIKFDRAMDNYIDKSFFYEEYKTMKKILSMILAVLMLASVAVVASADEEKEPLTVALSPDFSPMEFVDTSKTGQDQYVGFDVTLAKYIAEQMGKELIIKPMSFDACQAAVQTGAVDMSISGFSKTDERAENFNLSDFYYAGDNETQQAIITLKEHEGEWTTAEDFSGLTVGAQTASLQYNLCTSQLPEDCTIKEFVDIGTGVEALRNGQYDAIAVAQGNGEAIIASNDAIAFTGFLFEIDEEQENNVILLKKGADELTEQVNAILAQAYEQGLYAEWYADAKELAGIETAEDISYDEEGNAIVEEEAPAEEAEGEEAAAE